jgi:hypothetical protein
VLRLQGCRLAALYCECDLRVVSASSVQPLSCLQVCFHCAVVAVAAPGVVRPTHHPVGVWVVLFGNQSRACTAALCPVAWATLTGDWADVWTAAAGLIKSGSAFADYHTAAITLTALCAKTSYWHSTVPGLHASGHCNACRQPMLQGSAKDCVLPGCFQQPTTMCAVRWVCTQS